MASVDVKTTAGHRRGIAGDGATHDLKAGKLATDVDTTTATRPVSARGELGRRSAAGKTAHTAVTAFA